MQAFPGRAGEKKPALTLNFTAASDRGLVRNNNEDAAYAGPHLLVLADGMGGHAAGEVASQLMVQHMEHLDKDPGDNDMLALVGSAADDGNAAIARHIEANPETQGMGTTCIAMMFNGSQFGVCHVGDSRAYLLRDGTLKQVTVDDTYVQKLVDEGQLDPEEVSSHPQKSIILKAYAGHPVEPTLFLLDVKAGDRILLCSDGLSDPVTASTIEETLGEGTPDTAARRLVELALRSGGPDNVTVVIADVVEGNKNPRPASAPVMAGALAGLPDPEPTQSIRPDTAASRAAALRNRPQVIEPDVRSSTDDESAASDDEEPAHRFNWLPLVMAIVLLAGVVGGGLWSKNYLANTYYLAVEEGDELTIHQGADFSIFGKSLNKKYQAACLTREGQPLLVDDPASANCNVFQLKDLQPATRESVRGLPSGSYDEVTEQLNRLSDAALPVCVTTEDREAKKDSESKDSKRKSKESTSRTSASETTKPRKSAEPSATKKPSATKEPSSEQRTESRPPGDLSSPGVDCREAS